VAGLTRKIGVVGFVLSVGVACTQLFGGDRQNTLAPRGAAGIPAVTTAPVLPLPPGEMAVCETGQVRCEGALLQTCADDRTSWVTTQRCAASALCQASPAKCLAATCSTDEMTCSGAALQKCNADRTGWDLFATCLSPAHCSAENRQCLTDPCTPGERRCDRSELDQSPVLEVCRDDRMDWAPLDACVTRELCDQTLTITTPSSLVVGSDGIPQLGAPSTPDTVLKCNLPACAVGEVRCEGAQLEFCSEGRTGWITAEECASPALCSGSLTNVSTAGTPVCLPPVCATGQHQCTDTGVLQVCSEDRTGFRDLETCIGAPFCNAALADQGQAGCRDAPCDSGQMQCNGAQIQVCREDRTGLDPVGAPCESAALCNVSDPMNAVCDEPVCRRGATSGDEFHCEGKELQRCNESLTVYDTVQTCVTAALCDATQRANGCKPPVCQPNQHACSGGFLQTCNTDQTGFDNTENCGSQAQCDANAGRCADPCEPGATRCNSGTGDLEQCRDRLTGWQPIADCASLALCDAVNGRCNICLPGEFSCADNQLRQCAPDGRSFSRQNIPPECAVAPGGGGGVRGCQNNQVVVNPCQFDCANNRCNECTGNQTQCVGNGQIRRCVNGIYGTPTSCSDGNACNGVESCQNNNCVGGQAPTCNDGNPCTNDNCNTATGCQFPAAPNRVTCDPPSGTIETCTNGARQVTACGQLGCAAGSTICNNCSAGTCNGLQFTPCNNGRFGAAQNCDDNNQCTNDSCSTSGCQHGAVPNRSQCVNGDIQSCNNGTFGNTDCGDNGCNPNSASCNACNANTAPSCLANGQRRTCVNGQFQDTPCTNGQTCQNGTCAAPPARCTGTGTCNASGSQFTPCVNGQPGTPQTCPINGNPCLGCSAAGCGTQPLTGTFCISNGANSSCDNGTCIPDSVCTPNAFEKCFSATTIQTCLPDGSGFVSSGCNNSFCSEADRKCVPFPCAVNQQSCSTGRPQVCAADRMGFQDLPTCNGTKLVSCPSTTGAPVSTECNTDLNSCTVRSCRASTRGTGSECFSSIAPAGKACRAGIQDGTCDGNGFCQVRCTVLATCPLSTDSCTNGICIPGCTVTGCANGGICNTTTNTCNNIR
jgi:hypothetical protein